MQQTTEGFEAEAPIAHVLVPIDAAPAWFLGIVGVEHTQSLEADQMVEGGERLLVATLGHDVVARCDEMAGVETDAHAG